jgi:hypothetical protein
VTSTAHAATWQSSAYPQQLTHVIPPRRQHLARVHRDTAADVDVRVQGLCSEHGAAGLHVCTPPQAFAPSTPPASTHSAQARTDAIQGNAVDGRFGEQAGRRCAAVAVVPGVVVARRVGGADGRHGCRALHEGASAERCRAERDAVAAVALEAQPHAHGRRRDQIRRPRQSNADGLAECELRAVHLNQLQSASASEGSVLECATAKQHNECGGKGTRTPQRSAQASTRANKEAKTPPCDKQRAYLGAKVSILVPEHKARAGVHLLHNAVSTLGAAAAAAAGAVATAAATKREERARPRAIAARCVAIRVAAIRRLDTTAATATIVVIVIIVVVVLVAFVHGRQPVCAGARDHGVLGVLKVPRAWRPRHHACAVALRPKYPVHGLQTHGSEGRSSTDATQSTRSMRARTRTRTRTQARMHT